MKYDENLPKYFTNQHRFLWSRMDKTMLNDSKLFEKQEIKWFCEGELNRCMKQFRPFYREIVKLFIADLPNIRKFILSKKSEKGERKDKKEKKYGNRSTPYTLKTRKIKGG